MQIVPGELVVFGTTGDQVIFDLGGIKPHVPMADVPGADLLKPGDIVLGYIWGDGSFHDQPEG